ncbi:MAG: hypothetical protein IPK82_29985 [Polyangiaceae bacterium]|nr:hypothetical protein [Polyangiaceae bacterium]
MKRRQRVTGRRGRFAAGAALCTLIAACSGTALVEPVTHPLGGGQASAQSNLRVVAAPARPKLALLVREGDPAPALAAVFATGVSSAPTVALAAVVEARLGAAGFAVDARADRSAFRIRWLAGAGASPSAFLKALGDALRAPLGPSTPEIAKASERVAALRRNPLPAPEAAPAADCAARLGLVPKERPLDPATPEGLVELEKVRADVLVAARASIGAVGPAAFCGDVEKALNAAEPWPEGTPVQVAWPAADTVGTFAANDVGRGRARVTVAARVDDPSAAVAAAEHLARPEGALRARLAAHSTAFRVTEVLGVARPHGGCISVTAETEEGGPDGAAGREALARTGAFVAAVAQKEIGAWAREPPNANTAAQAVVAATDPRDAAARAAWWALSGVSKGSPLRWATTFSLAPDERGAELTAAAKTFEAELVKAIRDGETPTVERRSIVERGQGDVWMLLASPCGTLDEGTFDAGVSSLAAVAAVGSGRSQSGLTVEPWVTPEGVGWSPTRLPARWATTPTPSRLAWPMRWGARSRGAFRRSKQRAPRAPPRSRTSSARAARTAPSSTRCSER